MPDGGTDVDIEHSTAGERSNNPGNIRVSASKWVGKLPPEPGQAFERFVDPTKGIRAIAVLLMNYQDKYGLRSVRQLIGRWAPKEDSNPTDAYAEYVAGATGVTVDGDVDTHDYGTMLKMVNAIIRFENGRNRFEHLVPQALRQAGITPKPSEAKPITATKTVVGAGSTATGVGLEQVAEPVANGVAPMLTDAGNQLSLASEMSTWIKGIAAVLIIGGIMLTIYGRYSVRQKTGE